MLQWVRLGHQRLELKRLGFHPFGLSLNLLRVNQRGLISFSLLRALLLLSFPLLKPRLLQHPSSRLASARHNHRMRCCWHLQVCGEPWWMWHPENVCSDPFKKVINRGNLSVFNCAFECRIWLKYKYLEFSSPEAATFATGRISHLHRCYNRFPWGVNSGCCSGSSSEWVSTLLDFLCASSG